MSYKFFYLYLAGGSVALLLLIYQIVTSYPDISTGAVLVNAIPIILLYYLAFKVHREKQDKDMM